MLKKISVYFMLLYSGILGFIQLFILPSNNEVKNVLTVRAPVKNNYNSESMPEDTPSPFPYREITTTLSVGSIIGTQTGIVAEQELNEIISQTEFRNKNSNYPFNIK